MSKGTTHCSRLQTYDEMTSIYALQALTIYVIILAADERRCNNVEMFIRIAMGVNSTQS
jgi:hypothetical protein